MPAMVNKRVRVEIATEGRYLVVIMDRGQNLLRSLPWAQGQRGGAAL